MSESIEKAPAQKAPPSVPRWLVRTIWIGHRALYSLSGGRVGLRDYTSTQWGILRLRTVGRQTGKERVAIVGYIEDGANLVTPAMNGWADPEPAWWLNLQANPEAVVELRRLWEMYLALGSTAFTDASAALRSRETALVIFEPVGE